MDPGIIVIWNDVKQKYDIRLKHWGRDELAAIFQTTF